jgi:hypothetical protein
MSNNCSLIIQSTTKHSTNFKKTQMRRIRTNFWRKSGNRLIFFKNPLSNAIAESSTADTGLESFSQTVSEKDSRPLSAVELSAFARTELSLVDDILFRGLWKNQDETIVDILIIKRLKDRLFEIDSQEMIDTVFRVLIFQKIAMFLQCTIAVFNLTTSPIC